ncbi:factor-independent urate hydroxylase [Paenibacillus tarimensis]|uniref:factor-independent urate hydroxylase n=1 Tax=Paenibacillus tarimensis TaxID=416012 RepID=UPI001F290AD5|nr:urate oxidase [Paenibacillus tarimensis]MCF2944728.1 urate oxidase [Paenibacillus tarimensis]
MMKLKSGRTLYYGKGDVMTYRTYAKPLKTAPVPESRYTGGDNVIFAHNVLFSVSGEALLASFTKGDNSLVIATDSMKNLILRESAAYEGATTEGLLHFIAERFFAKYPSITGIEISGDRIPFLPLEVPGPEGLAPSGLVYRRSHNDHASASLSLIRTEDGCSVTGHRCVLSNLQLIKVSGSSFYGFVRDEYTTLPDSFDRPLFIFLDIYWRYSDVTDALDSDKGAYAAAEQIRDIAHAVFHEFNTPSIQHLIYQIGLRLLARYPQLEEVGFESNNRTWETVVNPAEGLEPGVFTEPRPPYGFQGFTMTREDLIASGEQS